MDYSKQSSEMLMARFRDAFDEAAFDQVVSQHYRAAFVTARALLRDAAAAEDAVQEAFIRVVRQRHKYDPSQSFSPWFYRILRNACFDAQRKRGRHERKLHEFAETTPGNTRSERPSSMLVELLQALQPDDRELLILRFVQGLSFAEIARHFACSEEAAKKRGQRAVARLRQAERPVELPNTSVRDTSSQASDREEAYGFA